ncbi:MAG TPA: response regulator transcription factor [Thermoanaerobaculia bacterium]|nr:response regulator transcription factor [Thermoanaerobaculia bacterium]
MREKPITVAIAHGQALYREGLRCMLERCRALEVVGESGDGFTAVDLVRRAQPGVIVMGIPLPQREGLDTTREILSLGADTRVLVLGPEAAQGYAIRVLRAGAQGFLTTSASAAELIEAIDRVRSGKIFIPAILQEIFAERYFRPAVNGDDEKADHLTDREFQVMCSLASGHSNKEVAGKLCISLKTVDTHRGHVLKKLGLRNNADLARFAIKKQFIQP